MMETWELTEYEQERRPQEIALDSAMAISPRSLHREMICPICLDILKQTRAAPDCLHRFCKKCIDKALKKECPICRKKLPSQIKSFREDPHFDQLIAKIYKSEDDGPKEVIVPSDCEIIFRPLNEGRTRFIKCPLKTTVDHLCKYLSIRPEMFETPEEDIKQEYKLCIVANRSEGRYEMLPGYMKLEKIQDTYKLEPNKPLELHYFVPK